ncbi:MAG: Lrp/AsnC family transcriptional regulator [Deltaproteobacteria bacterium]|nr:MAG: Lrp/AsnC family transcriptional regulator [Deltaproteobacteria bacterium]
MSHPRYHDAFTRRIQQIPEVLECHRVAGLDSYVLKVACLSVRSSASSARGG